MSVLPPKAAAALADAFEVMSIGDVALQHLCTQPATENEVADYSSFGDRVQLVL
jgi:hypothetical protein